MNPTIFGVIGPGFLSQVPTLLRSGTLSRRWLYACAESGSCQGWEDKHRIGSQVAAWSVWCNLPGSLKEHIGYRD